MAEQKTERPFQGTYEKGYPAPNYNIDPKLKSDKAYCVKKVQNLYNLYLNDKCAIAASAFDKLCEIRKYGMGAQDQSKYMSFLGGPDGEAQNNDVPLDTDERLYGSGGADRKFSREGWQNMAWNIVSVMPKIKANIKGLFSDIEYDIIADNIDADSGAEQEHKKWALLLRAKDNRFITQYKINGGLPVEEEEFLPESATEAEMYAQSGGFKTYVSKAIEELLKYSFEVSNWDEIKDRLIDDLVDFNMGGSRTYYCEETGLVKARVVDLPYAIIQYSKNNDYNALEFAGELVPYTILQLRQKGFTEEILNKIAKGYNGRYDNPMLQNWQDVVVGMQRSDGSFEYDDFRVWVCDMTWLDDNSEYKTVNTDRFGQKSIYDQEWGKVRDSKQNKTRVTKYKKAYECKWVVGTDEGFDFGVMGNQPYPAGLPYNFWQMSGSSITQRLVPVLDNIQLGWLKYQNAMNSVIGSGYAIDYSMLSKIKVGKKDYEIGDVIKFWMNSGILPFRSNYVGHQYQGGAVSPIIPIQGQMLERIQEAAQMFAINVQMIEQLTGLNPVVLGETPGTQSQVKTTEMSVQAAHNILKPIILSQFKIKEKTAQVICEMINLAIRNDKRAYDNYSYVTGQGDVDIIKEAERGGAKYGIHLEARPTIEERQELLQAASISLGQHRDGKPGITLAQHTYIVEQLAGGANLKKLRMILSYMQKKADERDMAEKQSLIQQQTQGNMQLEQTKAQGEMQKKQMDIQGQIAVSDKETENAMKLAAFQKQLESGGQVMPGAMPGQPPML